MAQPQPPVPNIANLNAAANGMTAEENNIVQSVQASRAHRQQFTAELSLSANYPVAQVHQQLAAILQSIQQLTAKTDAE